jgi:hypothetical protein
MHMTLTQLVLGGSTLLALSAVGIALGVALWMAFSSAVLGQKTCSQCGAQLPVLGMPSRPVSDAPSDWTCNKCGTPFDSRTKTVSHRPF